MPQLIFNRLKKQSLHTDKKKRLIQLPKLFSYA